MKLITAIFLFSICWMEWLSQEIVSIGGTVTDQLTGLTLPGAHVVIRNKEIATVTDQNGQFHFQLNEVLPEDILVISFVGYTDFETSVSKYLKEKEMIIRLLPSVTELNEIVIMAGPRDISKFMGEVLDNYHRKRRKTPHVAKGYYREKAKIDSKYVMFNESIGYAVFNGLEMPHTGYFFYCENTRRSDSRKEWKDFAIAGVNGEKLSDVFARPSGSFGLFQQIENKGPLSRNHYKEYLYHLGSVYLANYEK